MRFTGGGSDWTPVSTLHPTVRVRTPPHRPRSTARSSTTIAKPLPVTAADRERDLLRAAFRDLHGSRLHGFALLVAAGDRSRGASAAADALAAGAARAPELRHPERAAAWLRARVVADLRRHARPQGQLEPSARAALAGLGASDAVADALGSLTVDERAALVAAVIEGLEPIDIETILATTPVRARRAVARARGRYLQSVQAALGALPYPSPGALAARVQHVAGQAMGGTPQHRLSTEAGR